MDTDTIPTLIITAAFIALAALCGHWDVVAAAIAGLTILAYLYHRDRTRPHP